MLFRTGMLARNLCGRSTGLRGALGLIHPTATSPLVNAAQDESSRGLHMRGLERSLLTPVESGKLAVRAATSGAVASHTKMFLAERIWAVGMLPLFPTAYFIHGPMIDMALAVAVSLHTHWGLHVVVEDYIRPFLVGATVSKLASAAVYVISILMFVGLMSFNYNDVGITKAFEMVWSL